MDGNCGLIRLQLSVYKEAGGILGIMKGNAIKKAEQQESVVMSSGIPYTIIRAGSLQNTQSGNQGFSFEEVWFRIRWDLLWFDFFEHIHFLCFLDFFFSLVERANYYLSKHVQFVLDERLIIHSHLLIKYITY